MDKRQQSVQEAGGPASLCSKCRLFDFGYLGFQKANEYSKEKWRSDVEYTLAEATASAERCWICRWWVYLADNKDAASAAQIRVGFDTDRIETLEPQKLPYNDQNPQSCVNRVAVYVDKRNAGGEFEHKGFIQKAGVTAPVNVSDVFNSGNFADAEPYTARLRPLKADTRLFKFWKEKCMREHGESCGHSESMSTTRFRSMASIHLIDVIDACIVTMKTEDVSWVALSYVWGEEQKHALKKDNFALYHQPGALNAKNLPSTISNALTVTKEMGERYLWVDSLCIVQDNEEEKLRYIPAMDIIYGRSVFTIINAAVDKVSSGIPGIDEASPRSTQDVFEINGTWLTVSLDPPHSTLQGYLGNLKWNTRGWTYQECLMPRRCLIFTQEQVYWQCLSASLCEEGFWEYHAREDPTMYRHFLGKKGLYMMTMQSPFRDTATHWSSVYTVILEKFLQRQLTLESDRLDALAGILRVLEHSWGQEFFWGMPMSRLEWSLVWTWETPLKRNTTRQVLGKGGISSPFPSWSWSGWLGPVNMDLSTGYGLNGLLPLRFYRLDRDGNPTPIHNDFDGMVSHYHNEATAMPGSDDPRIPRYPNSYEHTWMDKSKTEIFAPDVPSKIRSSDAAPALLCFRTSTAVLNIHQEPQASNPSLLSTTMSDGKTNIYGFWGWNESKLDVTEGKFIVIGCAVERPSHGGRLLLSLMLVEEDDDGVCYRRHVISKVIESAWDKLENRKWEMVCLG